MCRKVKEERGTGEEGGKKVKIARYSVIFFFFLAVFKARGGGVERREKEEKWNQKKVKNDLNA